MTLCRAVFERILLARFLEKNPNETAAYLKIEYEVKMRRILKVLYPEEGEEYKRRIELYHHLCCYAHPHIFGQYHRLKGSGTTGKLVFLGFDEYYAENVILMLMEINTELINLETTMLQQRDADTASLENQRNKYFRQVNEWRKHAVKAYHYQSKHRKTTARQTKAPASHSG